MIKEDYEKFKRNFPKASKVEKGKFFYKQKLQGVTNNEIYELLEKEGSSHKSAKSRLSQYLKAMKHLEDIKGDDKMEKDEKLTMNDSEEATNSDSAESTIDDIGDMAAEKVAEGDAQDIISTKGASNTDKVVDSENKDFWEQRFPETQIMMIERDKLVDAPSDWNFFNPLDEKRFDELVRSIKEYSIQHNLVVQSLPDGTFRILSGHQRVKACDKLYEEKKEDRYRKFPCKVYKVDELDDEDARRIVIFTNTAQRGDLSLEDCIRSVTELDKLEKEKAYYGSKVDVKKEVAKILGVSRSAVFRLQNLSSLDKKLLNICGNKSAGKEISVREGEVLSKLSPEVQSHIFVKDHYRSLTPKRLSELREMADKATPNDVDKIFSSQKDCKYSVTSTVERPEGFETIALHVKPEEKVHLGEFLKKAIEGDHTLSEEVNKLLLAVAEELIRSTGQSFVDSAEEA